MSTQKFRDTFRGKSSRTLVASLLLVGGISFGALGHASANSLTYKGITLTPAVVNIALQPDQQAAQFTVNVTNNTRTSQTLQLSTLDFRSLNETGGVAFVGSNAAQLTSTHGLASWLDFDKTPLELAPHASKNVSVTVDNRSDLAPGGHYAAILFRANTADTTTGTNHVAINQVVSSLVFVSKVDGARYGIKLVKTSVDGNWLHLPSTANVVFQNTGNIQSVPRGLVTVNSPTSREVSRGIINPDSNLVLPDSRRLYQVKLTPTGRVWWPGMHHLTLQYRYDGSAELQTTTTTFFYASPAVTGVIIVLLLVLGYGLRKRRQIFRFIKRSRQRFL